MSSASPGPAVPEPARPDVSVELLSRGLIRKLFWVCLLGALVYAALPLYADARHVMDGLEDVSASVLLVSVLLGAGNFVMRFIRWEYYLRKLGIRVPFVESSLVFLAGFAMSITPAKMGEVLKSMMLRESQDVPIARSAPVVLAERITDVAGLVMLGGVGAWGLPGGQWVALISVTAVTCLAVGASSQRLGEWAIELVSGTGRRAQLKRKLLESHASLRDLMSPPAFLLATIMSVIAWGLQGLCLATVANGYPGVSLSLGHAMVAYCAPLLAGTLAMIPGGLGLTEGTMAGVLTRLGGVGATAAIAASITIVVRVCTFWLAIAIGFAALFAWQARRTAAAASTTREA